MPEMTPDSAIEDYEVLSYHSSDNELEDDDRGGQSQTSLLSANWDGRIDSSNAEQNQSLSVDTIDDSLNAEDGDDTSSSVYGGATTSWAFPSSIGNGAGFMASLDDGIPLNSQEEPEFDPTSPEHSLRFEPSATAAATAAVSQASSSSGSLSGPRIMLLRSIESSSNIKYAILSGVYRLSYQPWLCEIHRQFPKLQLIWVDTKSFKASWVTKPRDNLPSRKQLSKRAIRMDFHFESSDHSHQIEQELDARVLPGYKRMQSIAIHPLDATLAAKSVNFVVSSEAPVELSADGKATAIRHLSSLKYIETGHLAAVSRGSRVPISRHKANRSGVSGPGRAPVSLVSVVVAFIVVGLLFLISPVNVPSGLSAVCVKESVTSKLKSLYATLVHRPFTTSQDQLDDTLMVSKRFNFNGGISLASAQEISSLIVTSLEQLDDFLREVAIKVYGLVTNAGRYAEHQGAWAVKNVQDLWQSKVNLQRVL